MAASPVPEQPPFEPGATVRFLPAPAAHALAAPNKYAGVELRVVRCARRIGDLGWCVYVLTPEGRQLPPFQTNAFEQVNAPTVGYSTAPVPATTRMRSGTWFIPSTEWKAIKQIIAAARVAVAMGNEASREQLAKRLEEFDDIESKRANPPDAS